MSAERGPEYLESVYLFGTPDEIIASLQARVDAGVEYFFLHTMTPDPAQLQLLGRPHHPERHLPGDGRTGPPPADALGDDPARRPARQAAQAAALAGHARRRLRRGRHRRPLRAARARAGRGRGRRARRRAATGWLGPRRDRAVQAGRGRRSSTRSRPTRRRSARSTTSCAPTTAGSSASTPTRPGSGPASSWPWVGSLAGADVVVVGAGGAAHAVVYRVPGRRGAAGRRSPTGRWIARRRSCERFAAVGSGAVTALAASTIRRVRGRPRLRPISPSTRRRSA